MGGQLKVLFVEASEENVLPIVDELRRGGYDPDWKRVDTSEAMNAALKGESWDIVFSDYATPHLGAIDALAVLKEKGLDLPFIIVSGRIGAEAAVAAVKAGAHDCIVKDKLEKLLPAVERELQDAESRRESARAEQVLRESEARYRHLSESLEETVKNKVAELKQAETLATIGRMVSTVAHEVRNPLQNIQIGVDTMRQEIGDHKELAEILEGIDYGVSLLNGIITELLDYSRPLRLRHSPVSIRDVVERALKTQARRLSGIDTNLELDGGDRRISVDAPKFSAVLVNLIANAAEAMPRGGELTIRSKFHGPAETGTLRLSVSDTGCGIGREYMERIEEPFFTTKITGTGLGLPICRKIIEAHGGSLTIRSEPEQGTTVEILLPQGGSQPMKS